MSKEYQQAIDDIIVGAKKLLLALPEEENNGFDDGESMMLDKGCFCVKVAFDVWSYMRAESRVSSLSNGPLVMDLGGMMSRMREDTNKEKADKEPTDVTPKTGVPVQVSTTKPDQD